MSKIQQKVFILIYYPGKWVLKANVLVTATIKDIKPLIPEKDVDFIHNGMYLSADYDFQFYGVKERDVIVVIPSNRNLSAGDKWANLTKDIELFREKVSSVIDPRTSREAAKLRDFQMLRLERKPRYFRKLCSSYANNPYNMRTSHSSSRYGLSLKQMVVVEPAAASAPSTEPLPTFWAKPEPTIPEPPQDIVPASLLSQVKSDDVTPVRDD